MAVISEPRASMTTGPLRRNKSRKTQEPSRWYRGMLGLSIFYLSEHVIYKLKPMSKSSVSGGVYDFDTISRNKGIFHDSPLHNEQDFQILSSWTRYSHTSRRALLYLHVSVSVRALHNVSSDTTLQYWDSVDLLKRDQDFSYCSRRESAWKSLVVALSTHSNTAVVADEGKLTGLSDFPDHNNL